MFSSLSPLIGKPTLLRIVGLVLSTLSLTACSTYAAPDSSPPLPIVISAIPANRYEKDIAAFEAADQKQMPPSNAVLFVGSSSIKLWRQLETDFPGVPVINRGFGGSIIPENVLFAPRTVWPYNPRAIVFYAGDNDLKGGRTPEGLLADWQEFVRVVREKVPAAPIAFVSIKPSPSRATLMPTAQKANTLIANWMMAQPASAHLTYIDVWTAMTTPQNQPRPELFGPDMLHMNRKGYDLWTKILTPFVTKTK